TAKLFVSAGAPLHLSAGETFAPSHVYLAGISWPSEKAELVSCIADGCERVAAAVRFTPTFTAKQIPAARPNTRPNSPAAIMQHLTPVTANKQLGSVGSLEWHALRSSPVSYGVHREGF